MDAAELTFPRQRGRGLAHECQQRLCLLAVQRDFRGGQLRLEQILACESCGGHRISPVRIRHHRPALDVADDLLSHRQADFDNELRHRYPSERFHKLFDGLNEV